MKDRTAIWNGGYKWRNVNIACYCRSMYWSFPHSIIILLHTNVPYSIKLLWLFHTYKCVTLYHYSMIHKMYSSLEARSQRYVLSLFQPVPVFTTPVSVLVLAITEPQIIVC